MLNYLLLRMVLLRKGRVAVGVLVAAIAVLVAVEGFMEHQVHTVSGKPIAVSAYDDQQTGARVYTELQLSGSTTVYKLREGDFSPPVTDAELEGAAHLDLWYRSSPLAGVWVTALQMHGAKGQVTRALTHDYPTPSDGGSYVAAAIIAGVALLIVLSGIFLPDVDYYGRGRKAAARASAAQQSGYSQAPYPPDPYGQQHYQPGGMAPRGSADPRYGGAQPEYGGYQQQSYGPHPPPAYVPWNPQATGSDRAQPGAYDGGGQPPYSEPWEQGRGSWGSPGR